MTSKRTVVGNHALQLNGTALILYKNGFCQGFNNYSSVDKFDAAVLRLEEYYLEHGDSFLADAEFVRYVLHG